MVKNAPIKPDITPPNSGNEMHRTEYTNDDYEKCDQSERGRERN